VAAILGNFDITYTGTITYWSNTRPRQRL